MLVDVYMNLNDDCISVRSRETEDYGTVVAHRDKITVVDAEFVVQPAGRERVRETGRKNVHAFVRGEWDDSVDVHNGEPITYDPYENETFVHAESGESVEESDVVTVTTSGVWSKGLY